MKKPIVNFLEPSQQQLNSLLEHYQTGRLDDAEKLSLSITEEFPKHQFAWKVLAVVLELTGRINESLIASQKSLQLEPQDSEGHNNLGITLKKLDRLKEAETSLRQAIKLKPDFAEAHSNLGATLQELGRLDEAETSYRKAITLKPDNEEAKHLLSALTGKTTNTAPRVYVERLFNNFAINFEHSLVNKLEYKTPNLITELIVAKNSNIQLGSVLDLGCGTGLIGDEIKKYCSNLEGIDLSKSMLEKASAKNIYDKLQHKDIVEYLSTENLDFNYFISTDVFIYVGELSKIFRLIKSRNKSKGKFAFSTEHTDRDGFFLEKSGRYSHSKKYIESLCNEFGYKLSHFETTNLRKEKDKLIIGGLYLLDF